MVIVGNWFGNCEYLVFLFKDMMLILFLVMIFFFMFFVIDGIGYVYGFVFVVINIVGVLLVYFFFYELVSFSLENVDMMYS